MNFLFLAVVNALELDAFAERPIDRKRTDAEDAFQFIEQIQRRPRRAIQLVHESENRHATTTADLEKLARLRLNALTRVDHHHDRIHRREHAVSVFGKVLVPRRIEQIDRVTPVFKLQNSRADTDAAFPFEFHPIGGRRPLVFPRSHRPSQLHRSPVKQQFLRQRSLTRIRVRDDRKRAAAVDFRKHKGRPPYSIRRQRVKKMQRNLPPRSPAPVRLGRIAGLPSSARRNGSSESCSRTSDTHRFTNSTQLLMPFRERGVAITQRR